MKALVFVLIAGVAGLMFYLALRGDCADGVATYGEASCLSEGRLPADICRMAHARAAQVTAEAATVYPSEARCLQDYAICRHSAVTQGWTPEPAGFCIRHAGGAITAQTPLYRRINAAELGSRDNNR